MISLLKTINVEVSSYEIVSCHRLRKEKNAKYSAVIVRFTNRKFVFNSLKNSYKLKKSSFKEKFKSNLYIRENLCPYFKKIFSKCFALYATEQIHDVYTKNGKIFIQTEHSSNPVCIYSFEKLDSIIKNLKK